MRRQPTARPRAHVAPDVKATAPCPKAAVGVPVATSAADCDGVYVQSEEGQSTGVGRSPLASQFRARSAVRESDSSVSCRLLGGARKRGAPAWDEVFPRFKEWCNDRKRLPRQTMRSLKDGEQQLEKALCDWLRIQYQRSTNPEQRRALEDYILAVQQEIKRGCDDEKVSSERSCRLLGGVGKRRAPSWEEVFIRFKAWCGAKRRLPRRSIRNAKDGGEEAEKFLG